MVQHVRGPILTAPATPLMLFSRFLPVSHDQSLSILWVPYPITVLRRVVCQKLFTLPVVERLVRSWRRANRTKLRCLLEDTRQRTVTSGECEP